MQRTISALTGWNYSPHAAGRFELLRRADIEFVEVMLDESFIEHDAGACTMNPLRDALERAELRVSSCHLGSGTPLDPQAIAQLENKLTAAHHLNANHVVAQAGAADNDDEFHRILDHLRRLADRAADYEITIALDTQPGLMQDWRSMRTTIEELDHPQLRINFDPGNLLFYNHKADDETSVARIAHLVAHVHLHDSAGFAQRAYGPLGRGAVNFFRLRETLDVSGFRGPYSLILDHPPDRPEPNDEVYLQQLRESMHNLRWCGYLD